ncbi:hypothetical protein SteCoe_28047 [Stentor coeruleus]|uniref:Uncharacterized protein n=1 Tax=Stentor coeruleus TaxID=5963 RepID=A0A1R2B954_9CILI|nr:hypothetical protein SteCoe_28047 [Stentor coeruleus]
MGCVNYKSISAASTMRSQTKVLRIEGLSPLRPCKGLFLIVEENSFLEESQSMVAGEWKNPIRIEALETK